ncbi:hypothetical protein [Plantactinospora sp. KBS50]|uniref:hypothetical protein n=1 Tax=Plantactinospora sp. KBS50 TaxID=2024580 RepID=UPI000BAACE91|nr:hypothetical protein [Plantactinospora sp. KBS50]ASW55852.1 hypothetical protein CIK06_19270 [Plantactinospora sp. KBS50]
MLRRRNGTTVHRAYHVPLRPTWLCRICAAPWPCGSAKLALLAGHGRDQISLMMTLAHYLHEALYDLAEVCGPHAPAPQRLHARFLGWVTRPHRQPRGRAP